MPLAPEYQAMFDELAAAGPSPNLAEIPVADARAVYRAMRPINPELSVGAIENAQISGPSGAIPSGYIALRATDLSAPWFTFMVAAG